MDLSCTNKVEIDISLAPLAYLVPEIMPFIFLKMAAVGHLGFKGHDRT